MLKATFIRLVYIVILFLASLVISNIALPGKFGILSMLILNASLLLIITGFGVDSIALFKVSNNQWNISQAHRFIWKGIVLQAILFGLLELAALLIFHKTLLSNATPDYFFVDVSYFLGLAIVDKYVALYYSQHQSSKLNIILASVAFLYLLLLLLCYYVVEVEWRYVLYLFGLQNVVQALALIVGFTPIHNEKSKLSNNEFFRALKMSSIVMVTNVIQLLAYRVDFWMISFFYGNYDVGIYAQANKFANFAWVIPNILSQILIPRFATMKKEESSDVISAAFILNFFLVLLTFFFAHFFYFFYLDRKYREGLNAFHLMLPGYFFWGTVIYFGNYFSAKGKFLYNLLASSLCFVLIIIIDLTLIPRYGISGAAVANSITYFTVFIFYIVILVRKSSFMLNDLLVPRRKSLLNIFKLVIR
jgi:O-antigen/teichoic acid export membrane protein